MSEIRTMTTGDYEAVYRLWRDTPGMGLNTLDDSAEGVARYLARNPGTCFVAERNGEIVGVILSGHDGRRGFIYHAAVRVSERGKGVGGALVDRAVDALKQEGIHKAALVAYGTNETGNAFWEKRGFTRRADLVYRNRDLSPLTYIKT
ncbi:MAG: GNAT family N-acetyltransferase [Oscillospiraceae bacterium]|nr:GNAT family N-acetyltransferase [Oscillospiraceae bacterium]